MATKWISPTWRMPEESNQSKVDNYSLEFNGSDEHIAATYSGDVYACSIWFKPDTTITTSTLLQYLISFGGTYDGVLLGSGTSSLTNELIFVSDSTPLGRSAYTQAGGTITNTWHHLCFNWSGSVYEIWLDGVNVQNTTTGTPTLISASQIQIGRRSTGTSYYYFEGEIGQTTVYDSALTSDQITALYNSGTPVNPMALTPLPTAYYPLGGGSTGDAADPATTLTVPNESVPSATVFDFEQSSSQNIDIGSSTLFDSTSAFSFSTWCKLESYDNSFPAFIRLKTDQSTGFVMGFSNYNANYYGVWFGSSSNFLTARTAGNISADLLGVWKNISLVYDGVDRTAISSYSLYINGVPQSLVAAGSFGATPNTNVIGQGNTASTFWDGEISNTQIWDTNLSPSEITTLYNNGVPYTGTQPQAANLKGWWKMNVDTSTWNGSDWVIGDSTANYTTALDFDGGINNGVNINNDSSLEPLTSFTLSCWIKSETSQNSYAYPVYKESSNSSHVAYGFYLQGSQTIATTVTTSGFITSDNIGDLRDDKWHHIVQTYDGSGMKVYLDGVQSGSTKSITGNVDYSTTQTKLYIGETRHTSPSGYFSFKGEISNVALFNSAIDAAGVSTLFNSGTPQTSISYSPTSWWKLDNITTGIQDSVGSNNGTITGGVTQVNSFVSTLNGISSGMTTANLVTSDLTRSIPYSSYSMVFDGTADYIDFGNVLDQTGATAFSVSAWVKITATASNTIVAKMNSTSYDGYQFYINAANKLKFLLNDTGDLALNGGTVLSTDTWYHVVLVYDGDVTGAGTKIYLNGQAETITVTAGPFSGSATNSDNFYIGGRPLDDIAGNLNNVAFWNSAITENQVLTIYNGGVPNDISSLSPVSWWSLAGDSYHNGSNWICPDLGSAGNNGTSTGIATTALVGDGPGSTANGIATSMDIPANLKGNAPNSSKNAFSVNMNSADRVEDVPA